MKNAARRERDILGDGREFSSIECHPDEWVGSWASFNLPSAIDRTVVYSVWLRTAQHAFMEDLESKIFMEVFDEAKALPEDETTWTLSDRTNNVVKGKTYTMNVEEQKLDIFDGRTRYAEIDYRLDKELGRLKENGGCEMRTSVKFRKKPDWRGRIRVEAILPGPSIVCADINQWVRDFIAGGEKESVGELVPQDKLIYARDWRSKSGVFMGNPLWKDPMKGKDWP